MLTSSSVPGTFREQDVSAVAFEESSRDSTCIRGVLEGLHMCSSSYHGKGEMWLKFASWVLLPKNWHLNGWVRGFVVALDSCPAKFLAKLFLTCNLFISSKPVAVEGHDSSPLHQVFSSKDTFSEQTTCLKHVFGDLYRPLPPFLGPPLRLLSHLARPKSPTQPSRSKTRAPRFNLTPFKKQMDSCQRIKSR